MIWFSISILAYFFNAISNIVDKFLLKKLIPEPAVYAFSISLFGALSIVFTPFAKVLPSTEVFFVSVFSGVAFTYALYLFFSALKKADASEIAPAVGGLTSVFVLFFASLIVGEILSAQQLIAFFIIIVGGYFIVKEDSYKKGEFKKEITKIFFSALLFGLSHVLTKFVFIHYSFAGGMALRGVGGLFGAFTLLFFRENRKNIKYSFSNTGKQASTLFFVGQASAALGFILMNYAFSLGSVALVSALSGIQYVFLFIMIVFLSNKYSKVLSEKLTPKNVARKIISMCVIGVGIFVLFLP